MGTIIFLNLGTSNAVLASERVSSAGRDAEEAIINQQQVDEQAVCQRGADYSKNFLATFQQASVEYQQAFRQGVQDATAGRTPAFPANRVGSAGYQRGFDQASQSKKPVVTPPAASLPDNTNGEMVNQPVVGSPDNNEYPAKQTTNSEAQFISRLAKPAQKIGTEYDLYPSVIIAQAILESNWGQSGLSSAPYHNLFGVKGYFAGRATVQPTIEFYDGQRREINDHFRWYEDDYQALKDYAQTLQAPLYRGVHRSQARTYRQATQALVGRYATDPQYDRKLNALIDSYQLTRYDDSRQEPRVTSHPVSVTNHSPALEQQVRDAPKQEQRQHHSFWLPIVGGAGSAGLWSMIKRFSILK